MVFATNFPLPDSYIFVGTFHWIWWSHFDTSWKDMTKVYSCLAKFWLYKERETIKAPKVACLYSDCFCAVALTTFLMNRADDKPGYKIKTSRMF